jgi:hypothetical protein
MSFSTREGGFKSQTSIGFGGVEMEVKVWAEGMRPTQGECALKKNDFQIVASVHADEVSAFVSHRCSPANAIASQE